MTTRNHALSIRAVASAAEVGSKLAMLVRGLKMIKQRESISSRDSEFMPWRRVRPSQTLTKLASTLWRSPPASEKSNRG